MDEEEVFYVKAIPHKSSKCKFEVLFTLNSAQEVTREKYNIKEKTPTHEDGSPHLADTHIMESPPVKRSLFNSHDAPVANKEKDEKARNEDQQKNTSELQRLV
ncbi:hypothetical protein Adt_39644 [Abeliophyllum distichum]|uniref:Uncharacterized protein n=1 Tax=Abeliophyllum distichum TaxID=126358 RepID=A0ABD1Q5N8_9LAMI